MAYTAAWTAETLTRDQVEALDGLTLVEFGANWCPHCQAAQAPLKAALDQKGEVRHLKIEDGKGRPLGRSYGVKLWPNFVLLRDGQVVEQLARPSEEALRSALTAL